MKYMILIIALWSTTVLGQGCTKEEGAVKTAQNNLKQCKDQEAKKVTPRAAYIKEWTPVSQRQKKEKDELYAKHTAEWEAIIKKTGYDPRKEN